MDKNIALIIQGPMISEGRSGKTADIPATQVSDSDIVSFDCHANVSKIAETFGHLFKGGIYLATWEGQITQTIPGVRTLEVRDETQTLPNRNKVKHSIVAKNNKLKQFYLIQKALKEIAGNQIKTDGVIKVRTDQFVDLEHLVSELTAILDKNSNKLITSVIFNNGLFQDFYFAASTANMNDFVESYLNNYQEFDSSVHKDVPIRASLFSENFKIIYPEFLARIPLFQQYILGTFTERYLLSFSRETYLNTIWRGEKFLRCPREGIFLGEELSPRKFYFKDLLRTIKRLIIR